MTLKKFITTVVTYDKTLVTPNDHWAADEGT